MLVPIALQDSVEISVAKMKDNKSRILNSCCVVKKRGFKELYITLS